jgi:hypothetical protein
MTLILIFHNLFEKKRRKGYFKMGKKKKYDRQKPFYDRSKNFKQTQNKIKQSLG